jgi:hypothetical protein
LGLPISTAEIPVSISDMIERETRSGARDRFTLFFGDKDLGDLYSCWSVFVGSFGSAAIWRGVREKIKLIELQWSEKVSTDALVLFRESPLTLEAMVLRKIETDRPTLGRL